MSHQGNQRWHVFLTRRNEFANIRACGGRIRMDETVDI